MLKSLKSTSTEGLTDFVLLLFLVSEDPGTSWVMTESLQTANQLRGEKKYRGRLETGWGDPFLAPCHTALTPTEQVAAGDALLRQRGLHRRDGGRENVRLLQHLGGVRPVQRAEHCAVVELRSLVQFNHRELVPARLGAPVLVLQNQTEARVSFSRATDNCGRADRLLGRLRNSPPPSFQNARRGPVLWPFSEPPRG